MNTTMRNIDMERDYRYYDRKKGSFSKGFFWGAAIGALLGVIFAPDKGEETRKKIKKVAKEYEQKGEEVVEKAKEKYEEIKVKAEPFVEKTKEKINSVKNKIEENKEPFLNKIDEITDNIEEEIGKSRKRYFKGVKKR